MKVKQKNWKQLTTDEKREAVLPLSDMSAGEISKKLPGSSRNAIIGFCHRHKIPFGAAKGLVRERHKSAEQKAEEIKKRYSAKRAREAAAEQAAAEVKPALAEVEPSATDTKSPPRKRPSPPSVSKDATVLESEEFVSSEDHKIASLVARGPVSFMELTETTCRWPLNNTYIGIEVSEMMFCGRQAELLEPYCPECSRKTLRRAHEIVPKKAAVKKSLRLVGAR